jgi:hypothetical protein
MDDGEVIVCPAYPARKAVFLQPNTGVGVAVILDDVAWHPKTFWKMRITHVAFECYWPWSFRTETMSLAVVTPSALRSLCVVLGLCIFIPLAVLMARLGF